MKIVNLVYDGSVLLMFGLVEELKFTWTL